MARLKIDHKEVEVADGATVLEAAEKAGARIPTLCYTRETGGQCSCMICVVKEARSGRMLPSCSAKAEDGMDIDTCGDEVAALRRETLSMLLSEHVGDCEAPCMRICPASLDVPRMMRLLAAGDEAAAGRVAKRDLVFPATLGRICAAPCEKGCRRGQYDAALKIRASHGGLGGGRIERGPATGKLVSVLGAGLAGMSAAFECMARGHSCRVYDEAAVACLNVREQYAGQLPAEVIDAEVESVKRMGAELILGRRVDFSEVLSGSDAVIVASEVDAGGGAQIFRAVEHGMPVRSVANGKSAARAADAFLRGIERKVPERRYNSTIGRLRDEELEPYSVARRVEGAENEAARCLGCDCGRVATCRLRQYADEYGISGGVTRYMARPEVSAIEEFGPVLFERGKCIKCGVCVEVCRRSGEAGLVFGGRGLETRVELPAGGGMSDGLAVRCAELCPTGALWLRRCGDGITA